MTKIDDDQPIRLLHLSDTHFRAERAWDADPVLRALARFIADEVKAGLLPDVVAITGDLAFSGRAEEYALACEWLDGLWTTLNGIPRDRLLLVPGNHDVDRRKVTKGVRMMQDALLKGRSQDDIADLLSDEDQRNSMLKRHAAYLDFVRGWLGQPQILPWWQRLIMIRGTRLHVAGLDTAWMASGDDDRGQLLLGRYQLTQTVETGEAEGARWRIALLHHPWDYLAEFDHQAARPLLYRHCDLVLRGHLHLPAYERVLPLDPSRGCLEMAAGCVYESSQYPNAFQWVELSPTSQRVRVLFRAWIHGGWAIDRNQPGCPQGYADFALAEQPPTASTQVFISYSHDSIDHAQRVLDLANHLRSEGIDANLDQYEAVPPEGWTAWFHRQIEAADFVLVVCSKQYYDCIRGSGTGVRDARLIEHLYNVGSTRRKFVPVLFSDSSTDYIPSFLKPYIYFFVDTPQGYEGLYRLLTNQPVSTRPTLGILRGLTRRPDPLSLYIQRRGGPSPVYEAKMILVGFGGVGKTCIVKRLVDGVFDPHQMMTEGIEITDWQITIGNSDSVRVHIWDFGGQEILHATHQFFLTQRSLYILVLAGRQGREDVEAEYWLNLIESVAADSPIIVVLNKMSQFPFNINRRALQQKFIQICAFIETDCDDQTGLDRLKRCICHEVDILPGVRDSFPRAWFSIKERLGTMRDDYLTFERYREICADEGEIDAIAQERLAGYLHSLGVVINYRDDPRLRDTHVLNPSWITEGIYKILTHSLVAHRHGEISISDLSVILDQKRYPRDRCMFIVELMRKYELCFRFPETEDRYLIPQLLSREEPPEAEEFSQKQCLRFEYQYPTILPEGLIPRFIVRTNTMSYDQIRWRSGVILALEGNRGLVKGDSIDRRVIVAINGPVAGRRRLLAVIRSDFDRIHSNFTFRPEQIVPAPGQHDVRIPYMKLLALERTGITYTQEVIGDDVLQLKVSDLINGVDLEQVRPLVTAPEQPRRALRAFISYAHEDESLRAELETHLKIFRRQGLLDLWYDRDISAGAEWKEQIDSNLEGANLILFLVSADFVASDYCYDKELARAMELQDAKATRVIPIIVRDCKWKTTPLGGLQALPIDGRAVAAWGTDRFSRDTAWTNVAEGIAKVLLELRT